MTSDIQNFGAPAQLTENEIPAASSFLDGNEIDYKSFYKTENQESQTVPLWLITFTDVVALMLTFFVLMYSMAAPKEEEWKKISASLGNQFDKKYSKPFHGGTQDEVNMDRIPTVSALNLNYLKTVVTEYIKQDGIKDVAVNYQPKGLVISLPSQILFEEGTAALTQESRNLVYSLGRILSRIKNRIEVIGHTDPRPISAAGENAAYKSNWELSLARSVEVSVLLKEAGYKKEIEAKGLSSARYDELPQTINEDERLMLARRVDIVIMKDTVEQSRF